MMLNYEFKKNKLLLLSCLFPAVMVTCVSLFLQCFVACFRSFGMNTLIVSGSLLIVGINKNKSKLLIKSKTSTGPKLG